MALQLPIYWFPVREFLKYLSPVTLYLLLGIAGISAQPVRHERGSAAFFDSLENRLDYLQKQLPRLKESRDVAYYNLQREIDLTRFVVACEEFIAEEDLDNARKLVDSRLERAEFRRDQYSVTFYRHYKEDVFGLIKQQRIHYQALFAREKNFKKEFEHLVSQGIQDNYQKTLRMVNLSLKYARENNLSETVKYLESYLAYTQALGFDAGSSYDLAALTNNTKEFEKVFNPLVESDSLKDLKEAETLVYQCFNYARLSGSKLNTEYFTKQRQVVTSSLSDLLVMEGREKELDRYTDEAIKARFDTVNPCGVFKWHDQVIVIDEFSPSSTTEAVKKGEAILHADKMLSAYLKKNKLCGSINELKFGYAFIIPYQSNSKNTAFYYNLSSKKWQYIACYTSIVNDSYTQRVSKFMPPLLFRNEKDMADQSAGQQK
jgi:hypothetical protein